MPCSVVGTPPVARVGARVFARAFFMGASS